MKKTNPFIKCLLASSLIICFLTTSYAVMPEKLALGGEVVGIELHAANPIISAIEKNTPAERAGLKAGDLLLSYNGSPIRSARMLSQRIRSGSGFLLTVSRNGRAADYYIKPVRTEDGYTLGIRVRETISGIGTVTFIDPESGSFGALGHGVIDASANALFPVSSGFLVEAGVGKIKTGKRGSPGQLVGEFDTTQRIGSVSSNTNAGIFGTMRPYSQHKILPTAKAAQVHTGEASVYCTVEGQKPKMYAIEIERVNPTAQNGRNMLIRITDAALLKKTGGIVQGMSGSPVIQDGKIIGAVTHVLVNDPEKGYGIFIEKMLNHI